MELQLPIEQARQYSFYYGKGCARWNNSGYKGRTGIYELLEINDDVRDMITSDASVDDIRNFARTQGMTTSRGGTETDFRRRDDDRRGRP